MARHPPPGTDPRTLAGVVASYVASHPRQPELSQELDQLHGYLVARGSADVDRAELERAVIAHWNRLEHDVDLRRREAMLFSAEHAPRPVRYRYGVAFCPACGMYKNHRKECPHCGHLELTV